MAIICIRSMQNLEQNFDFFRNLNILISLGPGSSVGRAAPFFQPEADPSFGGQPEADPPPAERRRNNHHVLRICLAKLEKR